MIKKRLLLFAIFSLFSIPANAQFSGLVVFGDSLSDLGNTYCAWGDYGSYLLSGYNSNFYDAGRWSNGALWVEVLNRRLNLPILHRNNGYNSNGTDFAWGGATSGSGYSYQQLANLQTQVNSYLQLLSNRTAGMPDVTNTLFTIWSGGNDLIYRIDDGTPVTPDRVARNIRQAITQLYQNGGRYFLVANLPPMGEKPNYVGNPYKRNESNRFVARYNARLKTELEELQRTLSGITIIPFDCYSLFCLALKDPAAVGFTDVKDSAYTGEPLWPPKYGFEVDNPDQYLFWDLTHPTRAAHKIIGDAAYHAVRSALPALR